MVWGYNHKLPLLSLRNGNFRNSAIAFKGLEGEGHRKIHNVVHGGDMKCGPDSGSAVVWKFTPFSDFVVLSGKGSGKSVSEQNEV